MMRRRMRRKNVLRYRQKQKKNNKNKQKKYVKLNITNKLLTKTPNRRNKLNRCQFDVDITSIHKKKQKKTTYEFLRIFPYFIDVISWMNNWRRLVIHRTMLFRWRRNQYRFYRLCSILFPQTKNRGHFHKLFLMQL